MPTLKTPTRDEHLWTDHPLFERYKIDRGVTLLLTGSTVAEKQYYSQADESYADHVFVGGHEYEISTEVASILTAAGYGAYIS